MRECKKCGAALAPYIISMVPECKQFKYCPCCGNDIGQVIRVEASRDIPDADVDRRG
jgi:hypothetical protein